MRRGGRMGIRKPHVERHNAGLGAEPDQGRHEGYGPQARGQGGLRMTEDIEGEGARFPEQEQERQDDEGRSDMGHDEVEEPRIPDLSFLVLGHHEEIREQRHDFPHDQEEEPVVGEDDERHGEQKAVEEGPERANGGPTIELRHVTERIDRTGQADQGDGQHEKCGQRVETDRKAQIGDRGGNRSGQGFGRAQTGHAERNAEKTRRAGTGVARCPPHNMPAERGEEWTSRRYPVTPGTVMMTLVRRKTLTLEYQWTVEETVASLFYHFDA